MNAEPIFLLPEEVEVLTGFKTSARQVAWLRTKGWRFQLSGINRPIISRRYAETLLGCGGHYEQPSRPNFNALRAG